MSILFSKLEKRIQEESQKYYTDGSETVSDEEFDAMVDELKAENPDSPLLKTGWGYDIDADKSGDKVKHRFGEADSLEKCYDESELKPVFRNSEYLDASLKIDGISIVMYFKEGILVQAITRGDGVYGKDKTSKVKKILGEGSYIDSSFSGAIRGEIVMSYDNFKEFQKIHPEAVFPRNSTAGLIGAIDDSEDLRFLDIVVYSVFGVDTPGDDHVTIDILRDFLSENFKNVAPAFQFNNNQIDSVMKNCKDKWYGKWPADGIVLTYPTVDIAENGYMKYTHCAYKFASEKKESTIQEIEWNMSKTRYAVPRIKIDTIELAGAKVSYATGYNAKWILDNNIGVGTKVLVERRGEVIPNIVKIIESTEADVPEYCPICGEPLKWKGVFLICDNPNCQNAYMQDLLIWLETLVPRDKIGDTLIIKFVNMLIDDHNLKDNSIESIMNLEIDDWMLPPTVLATEFLKMLSDLHTKQFTLSDAIKALNIPRFGDKTCQKLASHPDIVKRIIVCADSENTEDLIDIYGTIGDANSDAIVDNIYKFKRLHFIENQIIWESNTASSSFKGTVAITGKLSVPRAVFEKELQEAGYRVGDVNSSTLFLITDNPDSASSKNKKADKFGIEKLTESEFRSRFI